MVQIELVIFTLGVLLYIKQKFLLAIGAFPGAAQLLLGWVGCFLQLKSLVISKSFRQSGLWIQLPSGIICTWQWRCVFSVDSALPGPPPPPQATLEEISFLNFYSQPITTKALQALVNLPGVSRAIDSLKQRATMGQVTSSVAPYQCFSKDSSRKGGNDII